ncbi:MAG TPA: sigma-70 family RNA polymerase sigma factor, partial [Polyangia bacterium]|nr:sigma-70 family RNA polymerase sigma factor [Polyangia bacterium]
MAPVEPVDFDRVFREYAAYVAAIALKIMGRDDDLDDLVQEVLIEAHRGLRRLRDPRALKSWLARITVRRAIRKLRRACVLVLFGRTGAGFPIEVDLLTRFSRVLATSRVCERKPSRFMFVTFLVVALLGAAACGNSSSQAIRPADSAA